MCVCVCACICRRILESLQSARLINKVLKWPKLQVFYEATQQKLAIKKFISTVENVTVISNLSPLFSLKIQLSSNDSALLLLLCVSHKTSKSEAIRSSTGRIRVWRAWARSYTRRAICSTSTSNRLSRRSAEPSGRRHTLFSSKHHTLKTNYQNKQS